MLTATVHTSTLFSALDETMTRLIEMVSSFTDAELNTIPFADSWTAGQVAEHLSKSNLQIWQTLHSGGETTERDPAQRAQELKTMFLDFSLKFTSAPAIAPTLDHYSKATLHSELTKSIEALKKSRSEANLVEAMTIQRLGEITKLELLYLALYHTQRHIHQLETIRKKLNQ